MRNSDLFLLSCASVRRVFLKRVCSSLFMGRAGWFMILFGLSDCRWFSTIECFFDVLLDSCLCCVSWVGAKVCGEGSVFENSLFHLSAT